jgi:hypothetical protein
MEKELNGEEKGSLDYHYDEDTKTLNILKSCLGYGYYQCIKKSHDLAPVENVVVFGCEIPDAELFCDFLDNFVSLRDISIISCKINMEPLLRFKEKLLEWHRSYDFGLNSHEYDVLCDFLEQCKYMKYFGIALHEFGSGPKDLSRLFDILSRGVFERLELSLSHENLNISSEQLLKQMMQVFKVRNTLQEFYLTLERVCDLTAWETFCLELCKCSLLRCLKVRIFDGNTSMDVLFNSLNSLFSLEELTVVFGIDEMIRMETVKSMAALMNRLEYLSITLDTFYTFEGLEYFAELVANSHSLRYFEFHFSQFRMDNAFEKVIGTITKNGSIVHVIVNHETPSPISSMAQRNVENVTTCLELCETLLALKKYGKSSLVDLLCRDLFVLLSQHLLKTWTDREGWKSVYLQ